MDRNSEFHGLDFNIKDGRISDVVVGMEETEARFVSNLYDENDVVLHAGCGMGLTALHIAATGARVIAYEMQAPLVDMVNNAVRFNRRPLDVRFGALVPPLFEDSIARYFPGDVIYTAALIEGDRLGSVAVPVFDIRKVILDEGVTAIDLDVEGYELELLSGLIEDGWDALEQIQKMHIEYHMQRISISRMAAIDGFLCGTEGRTFGFVSQETRTDYVKVDFDTRQESDDIDVIHVSYARRGKL